MSPEWFDRYGEQVEEVRCGTKRSTNWAGYKVHLTETCDPDPDSVHLITQVQATTATEGGVMQVREIQTELKDKRLAPKTHLWIRATPVERSS